jgi:cystathionine beta-lyase family protein involved in aluminum resistance
MFTYMVCAYCLHLKLHVCMQVGVNMFAGVDGYGHGDIGRDTLDCIYAELFGAEAALVRVQCFSGTHAIASALFGVLRPGDTLLACSGKPYDTLDEVIGTRAPLTDNYDNEGSDPLPAGLIGNMAEVRRNACTR